jgi:D-tyrosyl-tRNA(Tyr) deacylase
MLYDELVSQFKETGIDIQTGIFAADMQVDLLNDGPITIILDY